MTTSDTKRGGLRCGGRPFSYPASEVADAYLAANASLAMKSATALPLAVPGVMMSK